MARTISDSQRFKMVMGQLRSLTRDQQLTLIQQYFFGIASDQPFDNSAQEVASLLARSVSEFRDVILGERELEQSA